MTLEIAGRIDRDGVAGKRPRVVAAAVGVSRTGKLGRCVATCALHASAALRRDTASRQAPSSAWSVRSICNGVSATCPAAVA